MRAHSGCAEWKPIPLTWGKSHNWQAYTAGQVSMWGDDNPSSVGFAGGKSLPGGESGTACPGRVPAAGGRAGLQMNEPLARQAEASPCVRGHRACRARRRSTGGGIIRPRCRVDRGYEVSEKLAVLLVGR